MNALNALLVFFSDVRRLVSTLEPSQILLVEPPCALLELFSSQISRDKGESQER